MKMNTVDWISIALIIVGGLNWGLVGIFDWNLVAAIFGDMTFLARTVYALVGISAVYMIGSLASKSAKKA